MNKRLVVLLAVLLLPAVVQASGTPAPPINPCTVGKPRCVPPGPSPCFRYDRKPCGVNPNGRHR
jgi:hypothetical protein